jgi:geranylgeranyl pyrophosphate synthase
VLGKFGSSNAILAGDILLFQGLAKLRQATETLSANQRDTIWALVVDSVLEICKGEALEIQLRNCRFDVTPIAYYEVINCKAVVPELAMKIGAVAGKGDVDSVEALGQFGRAYGVVSLVSEEFIDLFDFDELKSRLQNECPPLPLIYALQNSKTRSMLLPMITDLVNEEVHKKIVDLVLGSSEVKSLNKKIRSTVYKQAEKMEVKNKNIREELKALIMAPLEYLDFNPF